MIGSINLRQAGFISDAYDASSLDSIEDYPNDSESSWVPTRIVSRQQHNSSSQIIEATYRD